MNPQNNNEDALKRQLDGQQFPFDEAQWDAAKELLDKHMPQNKKRFVGAYYIVPIAILLFSAGTWFILQNRDTHVYPTTQKKLPLPAPAQKETTPQAQHLQQASRHSETKQNITSAQPSTQQKIPKNPIAKKEEEKSSTNGKQNIFTNPTSEDTNSLNNPQQKIVTGAGISTDTVPAPPIDSTLQAGIVELDSAENSFAKDKKDDKTDREKFPQHSLSPFFAYNYNRIVNPSLQNYNGTPSFGIFFNRRETKTFAYSIGISYNRILASSLNKVYTTEEYGFGIQKTQTTIGTNKLHYIELPILFKFTPYKRVNLMAGCTGSYLLSTQNTISQSATNNPTASTRKATNYSRGMQTWDAQWQTGIEANLLKNYNLHIGVLISNGLFDITLNNYYNNAVIDRNRRLQLYIRYDVYKF